MKVLGAVMAGILVLATAGSALAQGERHLVSQKDRTFRPKELTIQVGDVVVFQNDDETDHHIMVREGPTEFSSRLLLRGASYEVAFEQPGTWIMGCRIHPRMRLEITVVEPAAPGTNP